MSTFGRTTMRNLRWWYALALASAATVLLLPGAPGSAADRAVGPKLIRDVKTGSDKLGSLTPAAPDPIQDYVQPDTQIEPSIAVNPANPQNVVAAYQEGRIADGGDIADAVLFLCSDRARHILGQVLTVDGGEAF